MATPGNAVDQPLTVFEWGTCIFKLLSLIYRVPLAAITYPLLLLHGPRNIPPLRHIVFNEAIKCFVGALTPREVKAIMPTSADTYVKFCGDEKLPVVIEDIGGEEGQADRDAPVARLLWVGPRWESEESNTRQRKVLLYIHGGGFEMPLDRAHLNFVSWLQHRRPENDDLSIAFLEYSLTPRHQYPTQLRQCAAAVGHLMKRGLRPENLSLAGDSAGGQIILSFLSHLLHPHPSALVPRVYLAAPLHSVILISPAVSLHPTFIESANTPITPTHTTPTSKSMETNIPYDMLSPELYHRWTNLFTVSTSFQRELASGEGYWGAAVVAPEEWWSGLEGAVEKVRVVAGEREMLRDDVVEWKERVERGTAKARHHGGEEGKGAGKRVEMETVLAENEAHDGFMIAFAMGWKDVKPIESVAAVERWVKDL